MAQGKRYEGEAKLNMKKVVSLVVAIIVLIMVIISINNILFAGPSQDNNKIVNVEYYPVYTNERWGVIDTNGDIVIKPEYEEMIVVPNSQKAIFICVYDIDEKNGTYKSKALNENGEEVYTGYDSVTPIDNHDKNNNVWYEKGIFRVSKDGKFGVINVEGKELIKCEYDEINALIGVTNELVVKKDGKFGLINSMGTTVIEPEFVSISALGEKAENGYIIQSEKGYGIAVSSKRVIVTAKYKEIKHVFGNDMYVVNDGEWKVVNKDGETVLSSGFDDVAEIVKDNITIIKGKKYGIVSTEGKQVIPVEYDSLKYTFDNYYIAEKDGKFGLIDTENSTMIKIVYENITFRSEANFIEADNSNYQTEVYNKNLELKLTGIISEVNVDDGYIRVWKDNEYKYYNFKFEEKSNIDVLKRKNFVFKQKRWQIWIC